MIAKEVGASVGNALKTAFDGEDDGDIMVFFHLFLLLQLFPFFHSFLSLPSFPSFVSFFCFLFTLPFFLLSLLPLSPRPSFHAIFLQSLYDVKNAGDSDGEEVDHLDEEDDDMMEKEHARKNESKKKCRAQQKKNLGVFLFCFVFNVLIFLTDIVFTVLLCLPRS